MWMRMVVVAGALVGSAAQAQLVNQFGGTNTSGGGQAGIPYSGIGDYGTAPTGGQPGTPGGYPSWDQARLSHYHQTLLAVRKEGLLLRSADGGTLTPAHDAYLQAKIDAATRLLHSELSQPSNPPLGSNVPR